MLLFSISYAILSNIGNENKQMCVATLLHSFLLWESEVVFMEFILFLIYALGFSLTINVALLAIIYIIWTNKE